jgi:hypothetical protein
MRSVALASQLEGARGPTQSMSSMRKDGFFADGLVNG